MPRTLVALAALALVAPAGARSIDLADTRLVAEPATSGAHVAFVYADDLWVARPRRQRRPPADVAPRRRVAARASRRTASSIAFTGQYDGNTDVYIVAGRRAACRGG